MVSRFRKLIKDEEKLKVIICALIYALALNAPRLLVEHPSEEKTYEEVTTDDSSRFEIIFKGDRVHFFFIKPED